MKSTTSRQASDTATDATGDESASGWQLAGTAAQAYEDHLVPAIFANLARRLVAAADIDTGMRALDVACGTGIVARTVARTVGPGGTVLGVDVNPHMLAAARRAAAGIRPDIEWRQGDAVALPMDDDTVDVVLCQEALQFFPDPVAALREFRRVAVPGASIAFSVLRSLEHQPVYRVFADALGRHVGPDAAAMISSPFALGDREQLRTLADEAGLEDVSVRICVNEERFPSVPDFLAHEAASSPLADELADLEDARRASLVEDLSSALSGHLDDLGLAFHNETHVVTARAV